MSKVLSLAFSSLCFALALLAFLVSPAHAVSTPGCSLVQNECFSSMSCTDGKICTGVPCNCRLKT